MSNNDIETWCSTWLDEIALVASSAPAASIEGLLGQQDEAASGADEATTVGDLVHANHHPAHDVGVADSAETTPALTASLSLGLRSRSSSLHTPAAFDTDAFENDAQALALIDFNLLFGADQDDQESERDGKKQAQQPERAVTTPQMLRKRGRSGEDDSDDETLLQESRPIVKKRRQAHSASRRNEAAPEQSVEMAAHSTAPAAWQGPDASEASTSSGVLAQQASSAVAVSSAPVPQGKPLEMCRAIRVIQHFSKSDHWKNSINLAVQAIESLPRNAPPASLPARKVLTDTDKALLRSLGPRIPGRRASLADARYVECTACANDYGIASEPILRSRTKAHNAEYHQDRTCSACGIPVNGRDTDKARVHRMSCAVWHALVDKGFHKAWLRKNAFYTDEKSKREFWDAKQRKAAKALAGGDTELEIRELERLLHSTEVAGLELQLRDSGSRPRQSSAEAGTENEQGRLELLAATDAPPPVMYQERWMPWQPWVAQGLVTTTTSTGASNHDALNQGETDDAEDAAPVSYQEAEVPSDALVPGALGTAVEPSAAFATLDVNNWLDHGALVNAFGYDTGLHIASCAEPAPSDLASGGTSGVDDGEPRSIPGDTVGVAGENSVAATLPFPPAADASTAFHGDFLELDGYDDALHDLFSIS